MAKRTAVKDAVAEVLKRADEEQPGNGDFMAGEQIEIPPMVWQGVIFTLEGMTPLIVHNFGEKARNEIRERQAKKATKSDRSVRGPEEIAREVMACHYPVLGNEKRLPTDGRFGFPASALKKAIVSAAPLGTGLMMTRLRMQCFVTGEIVPISCAEIVAQEDAVRLSDKNRTVQLRYRPYYYDWRCEVGVKYASDLLPLDQLSNLLDAAGISVGIGENRPGKTGNTFGTWRVKGEIHSVPVGDLPDFRMGRVLNPMLKKIGDIAKALGGVS